MAITAAITLLLISSACVNAFAQTIEFDIKKQSSKFTTKNSSSDFYDIKAIRSNVTGLENVQLAKSSNSFASLEESQVQVQCDLKIPQGPSSKIFNISNVGVLLDVSNIVENNAKTKTYTLTGGSMGPFNTIAGHEITNGQVFLNGKSGTIFLNLAP
jgi:hypothetical protein